MAQVSEDPVVTFLRRELQPELRSIPAIAKYVHLLEENNINTTDQLLAYFFRFERDRARFAEFLHEELLVPLAAAQACAEQLHRKLRIL